MVRLPGCDRTGPDGYCWPQWLGCCPRGLRTGHIYGIFFDHSSLLAPGLLLAIAQKRGADVVPPGADTVEIWWGNADPAA
ncbi:hypothetical protein ACWDRB_62510 [Nonomuraea sp. NPDC003707]